MPNRMGATAKTMRISVNACAAGALRSSARAGNRTAAVLMACSSVEGTCHSVCAPTPPGLTGARVGYGNRVSRLLPPRAWFRSDAPSADLDGDWAFRLAARPGGIEFADPAFDDRAWARLPVPSQWQLHGYGAPAPPLRRRAGAPPAGPVPVAPPRVRRAGLHEHRLPVPGRPAARARREPDGPLPAPLRPSAGVAGRQGGAPLRGRGLAPGGVA